MTRKPGEEPDCRAALANERTYLAWLRTTLALLAGAVAVAEFVNTTPWLRDTVSVTLVLAGLGAAVSGHVAWHNRERAMREGGPIAQRGLILAATAALVVLIALVGLLVIAR